MSKPQKRRKAAQQSVVGHDNVVIAGDRNTVNVNFPPRVFDALHQLPAPPGDITGRKAELKELRAAVEGSRGAVTAGLRGMGGVGKTALALVLANELGAEYADAQFFVDLRGLDDAPTTARAAMEEVVRGFVRVGEKLPENDTELAALYRSFLSGKKALLILDNAKDASQVQPLLPPTGCLAIVTSRQRFALPGLYAKNIEQMLTADAVAFLLRLARRLEKERTTAERITELCGYLPLALRAAGSLLDVQRDLSAAEYADELSEETTRLAKIGAEGVEIGVEASLSLSYRRLPTKTAAVFRALAVFPATFDKVAAEVVGGDEAGARVSELVRYSLVEWDEATERYRLHDLARVFARGEQDGAGRESARQRHAEHYLQVLASADDLFLKGNEGIGAGLALFDLERLNIEAGQAWAAGRAATNDGAARLCVQYANVGQNLLHLRLSGREHIIWLEQALSVARQLNNRRSEGNALENLGLVYASLGQTRRAIEFYEQQLIIARKVGDRRAEGNVLGNTGNAYLSLGQTRRAIEFYEQQLVIANDVGDRRGGGNALSNLGNAYANLGETRHAIELYEQALVIYREIGDRYREGGILGNLGLAYAHLGETRHGIELNEQQLVIARELRDRHGEGAALGSLGIAYKDLGEMRRAIDFYEQQLVIVRKIGDRHGEGTALCNLGIAYKDLGEMRRAIDFYEQALAIDRELGNRYGEGQELGNLASAYYLLGETRRAIELYNQRLVIAREIGDRSGEGAALGNLGLAYEAQGEMHRAIEYHEQFLAIARDTGDRLGEGNALGNLGIVYAHLGETRRAIEFYNQRLVIAREIGDRHGEGSALGNLGVAYKNLGEIRRAIDLLEQQLVVVRAISDRRGEGKALANMALALENLGERQKAIVDAMEALKIFEAIEDPNESMMRGLLEEWRKDSAGA